MRRNGFVLLDLIAAIAVVSLIVSVTMPNLARSRESAKRASCGMNLSNCGKAIAIYRACYEDQFPAVVNTDLKPGAVVSTSFDAKTPTELSTTATMFLLMRDGSQSAKMYICPSTLDKEDTFVQIVDGDRRGDYHWDFSQRADEKSTEIDVEADQTSYGYAAPVTNGGNPLKVTNTAGVNDYVATNTALMADKGPAWGANATPSKDIPILGAKSAAEDLKKATSQNHKGTYINYLRADLSVQKSESPLINGKDNIYTAFKGDDPFKDAASAGTCETDSWKNHTSEKDSWIIGPKRK